MCCAIQDGAMMVACRWGPSNGGASTVTEVVIEKVLVLSECDLMNVIEKVRIRSESDGKTIDE